MSDRLVLRTAPDDGVVTLTLNRTEKKNALSIALRDELSDALDDLGGDEAVKSVVVTGAGDVFSAGFDLREFQQPELADQLWASSDRFHATVLQFPLPLIAAVNGPAIAGGFDLAVMSDVRVAADTARFSHPEIEFGDVVYGPLHDIVGGGLARELCFTGRVVAKNFDKAFRATNKRVVRMRASGSIEPEASVNRTRVIRWCLGNNRSESGISGFQKTTISILFAVSIALANSSSPSTSRSSWRNPAICQLADSSPKITTRSKPLCSSIIEREPDLRGKMKLTNYQE